MANIAGLEGMKVLIVENKEILNALKKMSERETGALIETSEFVPEDWTEPLVIRGIQAALMHPTNLADDIERLEKAFELKLPLVVLVSGMWIEEKPLVERLESGGIKTMYKSVGVDCYKDALKLLAEEVSKNIDI